MLSASGLSRRRWSVSYSSATYPLFRVPPLPPKRLVRQSPGRKKRRTIREEISRRGVLLKVAGLVGLSDGGEDDFAGGASSRGT
jgi:hypothetical protein